MGAGGELIAGQGNHLMVVNIAVPTGMHILYCNLGNFYVKNIHVINFQFD